MVDVGINGRISDGCVLFYSKLGELIQTKKLNLPDPAILPNSSDKYPFFFIGDEAFALSQHLMKPYNQKNSNDEQRIFNSILSRTRSVVENAFGILSSRFGVFQKPMALQPEKAARVTIACCYLHNFLLRETDQNYASTFGSGNMEKSTLSSLKSTFSRHLSEDANVIRNSLCKYYSKL